MVLGHSVALKGCAMRISKPTAALEGDTVTKRIAVMPLWRTVGSRRMAVDCGDPHVRRLCGLLIGHKQPLSGADTMRDVTT